MMSVGRYLAIYRYGAGPIYVTKAIALQNYTATDEPYMVLM